MKTIIIKCNATEFVDIINCLKGFVKCNEFSVIETSFFNPIYLLLTVSAFESLKTWYGSSINDFKI